MYTQQTEGFIVTKVDNVYREMFLVDPEREQAGSSVSGLELSRRCRLEAQSGKEKTLKL